MARPTIQDISRHRASSGPIPTGIAATTTSSLFQTPRNHTKPQGKPVKHHFSAECRSFSASEFKKNASFANDPDRHIVRLGVGRPNAVLFPWTSLDAGLSPDAQKIKGDSNHEDLGYGLGTALDYGGGLGAPPLIRFLTEHVELVHDPPYRDWGVCMTCGSTSGMETALRTFCNPGDTVLVEEFTYPGFVQIASLMGLHLQTVAMDEEGCSAEALDQKMSSWSTSMGRKPRLIYLVPCGQNPTGASMSLERRKAIYEIAEREDIIILEDDPYYFLDLQSVNTKSDEYLARLAPSFLSLDRSSRVVRLDSFSKILAPGLRAGWVTAHAEIIDSFMVHNETDAVAPSGLSQYILCSLLEKSWGHKGFFLWLSDLSDTYRRRLDIVEQALHKYLPSGICTWTSPKHGMFLWLRIPINEIQVEEGSCRMSCKISQAIEKKIAATAFEIGTQVNAGAMFAVGSQSATEACIRITFAAAQEVDLEQGVRNLAEAIRSVLKIR